MGITNNSYSKEHNADTNYTFVNDPIKAHLITFTYNTN